MARWVEFIVQAPEEGPFTSDLDGRTFQVQVLPGGRLRLTEVRFPCPPPARCPVIIKGEQCGRSSGHEGKHMWANGD